MKRSHTPAVKHDDLAIVASPIGPVAVHSTVGFLEAINAGLVKITVSTYDHPVTCFALPLLGPNAEQVIKQASQAVYEFATFDLGSVLAQWILDTLRSTPTVVGVMVTEPTPTQVNYQYEVAVARSIPCEPTRWNNRRTTERVNENYAGDSLLDAVAKAYLAIVKRPAEVAA